MSRSRWWSGARGWSAGTAIVACVVAGAMLAENAVFHGGARQVGATRVASPARLVAAAAPSPALVRELPVFATPRTAADDLAGRDRGGMAAVFYANQTHRVASAAPLAGVGSPADVEIFIAGGPHDDVCLLLLPAGAAGPGGACAPFGTIRSGGALVTLESGRAVDIAGAVPSGVESVTVRMVDGRTATLPVSGNAFAALMPGPTATISFVGPDGPVTASAAS